MSFNDSKNWSYYYEEYMGFRSAEEPERKPSSNVDDWNWPVVAEDDDWDDEDEDEDEDEDDEDDQEV